MENFNNEIEIKKRNKIEIFGTEMKNSIQVFNIKLEHAEKGLMNLKKIEQRMNNP